MKSILRAVLAVALVLGAREAYTQTSTQPSGKVEVFGTLGNGWLFSGDSEWGSGLDYGGGIGVRPFTGSLHGLGFELQIGLLSTSSGISTASSRDVAVHSTTATIVYHFARSAARVQPFAAGGFGYLNVEYTSGCVDCVFDVDPVTNRLISRGVVEERIDGNKAGVAFGGGAKVVLYRHLFIRPAVVVTDTTAGTGFNWLWVSLQLGVGVRF